MIVPGGIEPLTRQEIHDLSNKHYAVEYSGFDGEGDEYEGCRCANDDCWGGTPGLDDWPCLIARLIVTVQQGGATA